MSERARNYRYYDKLNKPEIAPPKWLFGVVWTILYPIILACFGFTIYKVSKGIYPNTLILPIVINLVSNALFTPIQFRLKNNYLALLDILICVASLIWTLSILYQYQHLVFWLLVPYLVWVSFATMLQISLTVRNGKRA
jgi:benzodiazapine receptor